MGKEIIAIAEALSNERAIPREKIFEALELALATATKKKYPVEVSVRVTIDRKEGTYRTFRRWTVVDTDGQLENPSYEISRAAAALDHPDIEAGEAVEEEIESVEFDRITIQTAKQVLSQKVKDAEREQIIAEQRGRVGQVISGIVKKQTHEILVLDLGNNAEAVLKREQIIPHETYGRGERVKVYLQEIREDPNRGPQIVCTRTANEFLRELFRVEVPEIGEEIIEIMGVARDPGSRAKIAVRSKDRRIDPRGACIGMRGARVTAVSNELAGEKIDVVLWDESLAQYVTNAMEPAVISRLVIDEDSHSIVAAVAADNVALAIGRNGQNVRLASQLIGWTVRVQDEAELEQNAAAATEGRVRLFMEQLNVDEEFARALTDSGFNAIEEIAYVTPETLLSIDGMDAELAQTLQAAAREALKQQAAVQARAGVAELAQLPGVDQSLATALVEHGIRSQENLAEQAVDDLSGIAELTAEKAGEIIMAARRICWFDRPAAAPEQAPDGATPPERAAQ